MRNGSVIIDLAASTGGNTPFTKNNETVNYNGASIIGNSSLQSTMPSDASKLYGKNMVNFLQLIIDKDANLNLNWKKSSDFNYRRNAEFYEKRLCNYRFSCFYWW